MEVAAQALSLHRVHTLRFDAAVFTNFSLEHSEFYANQDAYFDAKCSLFEQLSAEGSAFFNADDERIKQFAVTSLSHAQECLGPKKFGREFSYNKPKKTFKIHFYSVKSKADYTGLIEQSNLSALKMQVRSNKNRYHLSLSSLLGEFNASNLVAAIAVAEKYGVDAATIERAVATFSGVPGRLQSFQLPNLAVAFIDNAHTPASFEALLTALRPLSPHIIVVFGAGGDRDPIKRPIMGTIAARLADQVIVTTDNPRSEDPQVIINAILSGISSSDMHKIVCELDREQAIKKAYALSTSGSIIALLGKGPVEYQHIKDTKIPFSEASILRSL